MYPGVINGIVEQLVLECKVPSGCNFGVEIYNLLMRLGMNIDRIWWMSGQGPKWKIGRAHV